MQGTQMQACHSADYREDTGRAQPMWEPHSLPKAHLHTSKGRRDSWRPGAKQAAVMLQEESKSGSCCCPDHLQDGSIAHGVPSVLQWLTLIFKSKKTLLLLVGCQKKLKKNLRHKSFKMFSLWKMEKENLPESGK